MKKISLLIFLLVNLFFLQAQSNQVKVLSYNILNGFDWGKDTVREVELINWVNAQKPDVIALQELCGFTQDKLEKMAKKWGHDHALILKTKGYPVGITSNRPIELKEKLLDSLWHGMLSCTTWGIDFYVVHLSPSDWKFRRNESRIILEKIDAERAKNDKYIVLGDFNAHSPFDGDFDLKYPYQLERTRISDQKSEKYKNLRDGYFDYSVISAFLSLPLMDVCQRYVPLDARTTFPAPINVGKWLTAEEMPQTKCRLDFILVSPELNQLCTDAFIYNGEATQYLSDHYPVGALFKL